MSARAVAAALERYARRHGEKIAVGVAVLLVVAAGLQTDWAPYSRSPAEILERVAATEEQLARTNWPDSERTAFLFDGRRDPRLQVEESIERRIPAARYALSQRMQQRPGPGDRPLEEPVYFPVESVIAEDGRVLLRLAALPAEDQAPIEEPWLADELPDEFRTRGDLERERTRPVGVARPVATGAVTDDGRDIRLRGRAYPLVSVRGVFDVNAQILEYVNALHKGYAACAREFEIVDFRLERQELLSDPGFWSEWRPVDVRVYYDVVSGCDRLEADVVSADVIDSAITCPLPARLTGRWNTLATHPQLAGFELSEEELAREIAYLKALAGEADRQHRARRAGVQKRGFAELVQDAHDLSEGLFDSAPPAPRRTRPSEPAARTDDELIRRLALDMDPRQTDRQLREWLRQRARAARDLVLFRYFDFDVDPGTTYRYRVRLELRNPNYGRPPALAGGAPHVIEGATRLTPWSEPTTPVHVEETMSPFLTRIERPRARPYPEARMRVYQYDLQTGTTVRQELSVACGQFVGGTVDATVIDPVRQVIEERDYTFHSEDVLVDGLADLSFPLTEHPDLVLPANSRRMAGCTEYAVLVDEHHQLRTLDPVAQRARLEQQERRMAWQDEQFESLLTKSETVEWGGGGGGGEYETIYERLYGPAATRDDAAETPRPRHPLSGR